MFEFSTFCVIKIKKKNEEQRTKKKKLKYLKDKENYFLSDDTIRNGLKIISKNNKN